MRPLATLRRSPTDEAWLYALPAGLLAALVMSVDYAQSASNLLDLQAVFAAGLLGGLLYSRRTTRSRRVGLLTGLVGSVAVLWPAVDMLAFVAGLSQPAWFTAVQVGLVVVVAGLAVALCGLLGVAGAVVGDWLAGKLRGASPGHTAN
ncbi:DUF5518 domain-containing protein [Haloarchaeobius amylolyticus]|uniref:DUF5518 domain-containing protein n=1 Tax=Haloarchaeobius amylolyticus TaxID=1198296 RepID=UPI0022712991|nr:DUF5518 domain-containing protein [Haloarchaeobius amylolyticus]